MIVSSVVNYFTISIGTAGLTAYSTTSMGDVIGAALSSFTVDALIAVGPHLSALYRSTCVVTYVQSSYLPIF